ncbi:MAG: hypothetical protein EBX64_09175 [Betaproteobacteria bacterium]|nr:hypothetical protein [Betaproteobacteria bacterium]
MHTKEKIMWNLEGQRIRARYLGDQEVEGRVVESRVKYGGRVQHSVEFDQPIPLRWRAMKAVRVLIDHEEVIEVVKMPQLTG